SGAAPATVTGHFDRSPTPACNASLANRPRCGRRVSLHAVHARAYRRSLDDSSRSITKMRRASSVAAPFIVPTRSFSVRSLTGPRTAMKKYFLNTCFANAAAPRVLPRAIAAALGLGALNVAVAADDALLRPMVVTATRTAAPLQSALAPVSVLERADIER